MRIFPSLYATGLALAVGLCFAQTKITSVEGITEYRLDNGMKVLLFPDNSKPTVTVNITYLVGSRFEGQGETGMAHLLEHMVFKGTTRRGDIMAELRIHGADFNGSTWTDRTNYFETMPATEDNLHWALDMEADRMVNSRISRQDLDSEMTVVRNEFESGENDPARILEQRVTAVAYEWHGYGRDTIGARSDIEKVPIERLQAFYRNYYQPDNAVLVVAGKFDPEQALGWIKDAFGALPKPARKLIPTYTEEPVQDGEREVTLRRVGDNQVVISAYHIPAGTHPDSATLEILTAILTEQPAGRLYKALVDSKKAVSVSGDTQQYHDPGLVLFRATVRKEGDLADVEKTMLSVIDGVVKEPPGKEEVDRARARLLKQIELAFNNSTRVGIALSETVADGDWRLLFLDRDRIEKVTPEDVARVAKMYLKTSNRTLGRFIPTDKPDRAEVPAAPDLVATFKDYHGKAAVDEGEAFDPSPANIDARTVRLTLANGMKLALLPKKTRGGTVVASLILHFGDEKSVFGKSATGQLAGALLMRGTQKHTRQQLQDELDRLKVQLGVNGSSTGASANISTIRASFPAALRLAAEVLREPSFPESELEQLRQASLARIETSRSDPQAIAVNAMNRHRSSPYPPGDPRAAESFDESIANLKKVTLADVKKFYADFYGASHAELSIVGDFDAAEAQKLAAELFGAWNSPAAYSLVKRTWQKLNLVSQTFETPDKANAFFLISSSLDLDQDHPDYPALLFANRMLGEDPNSRLWKRVREKDGLSYGVQSVFNAGVREKIGQFIAIAICNPQNVVKVEAAFQEEIAKVAREGFSDAELNAARKTWFQDQVVERSQDAGLARTLARNEEYGFTMARQADLEKKVAGLTAAQVTAAGKKWFDPAAISTFKAGDFKKAGITQ